MRYLQNIIKIKLLHQGCKFWLLHLLSIAVYVLNIDNEETPTHQAFVQNLILKSNTLQSLDIAHMCTVIHCGWLLILIARFQRTCTRLTAKAP